MPEAFSAAVTAVSGSLTDMLEVITDNAIMMLGIAGSLAGTGIGLFKAATNQRRRRR